MANHPQAAKRNRQRLLRQAHHRHFRTKMRTLVKRVRTAVSAKDLEGALAAFSAAVPIIDRCAQRAVIPKKRASRTVSRLAKAINTIRS